MASRFVSRRLATELNAIAKPGIMRPASFLPDDLPTDLASLSAIASSRLSWPPTHVSATDTPIPSSVARASAGVS